MRKEIVLLGYKKYSYLSMVVLYFKLVPGVAAVKIISNIVGSVLPTFSIIITAMFLDAAVAAVGDRDKIGAVVFPLCAIIGISLFNYSSIQELRKLDTHRQAYANYFRQPFDSQVKEFGGSLQREQLSRLSNFKFTKHSRYNWDSERMGIILEYIHKRAAELSELIKRS